MGSEESPEPQCRLIIGTAFCGNIDSTLEVSHPYLVCEFLLVVMWMLPRLGNTHVFAVFHSFNRTILLLDCISHNPDDFIQELLIVDVHRR